MQKYFSVARECLINAHKQLTTKTGANIQARFTDRLFAYALMYAFVMKCGSTNQCYNYKLLANQQDMKTNKKNGF